MPAAAHRVGDSRSSPVTSPHAVSRVLPDVLSHVSVAGHSSSSKHAVFAVEQYLGGVVQVPAGTSLTHAQLQQLGIQVIPSS